MTVSMVFHIKDHAVQTPLFMFFSKGGACVLYHKAEYTSGLFRFLRNNFIHLVKDSSHEGSLTVSPVSHVQGHWESTGEQA